MGALDSKPPLQRIYNKFKTTSTSTMKNNYQQSKGAHSNNNNNRDSSSDSGEKIQFQQTFVSTINLAWQQCNERYLLHIHVLVCVIEWFYTPKLCQSYCIQQYMYSMIV